MSFLYTFLAIFAAFVLLFLVLAYFLLVHQALMHHLYFRSQGITTAPFIPVLGHIAALARYEAEDRNLDFWRSHIQLYGPVHAIGLANSTHLKVSDPSYLKAFLRTLSHCYAPSFISHYFLEKLLGEQNVLLLNGSEWSRHRRSLNPAFHHASLKDMTSLMVSETRKAIDAWTAQAETEGGVATVDFHHEVTALTFSIIAACAFGAGFSSLPNAPKSLHATMRWITEQTQRRLSTLIGILPVLQSLPLWGKPEMDARKAEMFALVDAVVRDRRAGKTSSLKEGQQDLLDLLLNARDETTGQGLTDAEVRDNAMTFVLAGHETTSTAVCVAAYALMTRPELWQQCAEEVQAVCGDDDPLAEQLSQLPLLEAVCNECLRLMPSVPIISKDCIAEHALPSDEAGKPELHLKVGQHVQVDLHHINRMPEYWGPDANEFRPARWLQGKKPYSHPFAFLTFSAGTRNCPPTCHQRGIHRLHL